MSVHAPRPLADVPIVAFATYGTSVGGRCAGMCAALGADVDVRESSGDPIDDIESTVAAGAGLVLIDLPPLDAAALARWNAAAPRWADAGLYVVAFSPFGLTGPSAGAGGGELHVQARSGLMSTTGYPDDPPLRTGIDATAAVAAMAGLIPVLASRLGGPVGDVVDVAQFDVAVCLLGTLLPTVFETGIAPARIGNRHPMSAPWNTYSTRDSWVAITTIGESLWRSLATLVGRPDLADDPRFATDGDRVAHADELDAVISEWTARRATSEVLDLAAAAGVPAGRIRSLAEALSDARAAGRAVVSDEAGPGFPVALREGSARPVPRPRSVDPLRPLSGFRIVEVGSLTSAPLATRLLAQFGAEVIKVEPPRGEVSRQMALPVDGSGYLYYLNNTDKSGVILDIREDGDRAQLDELLRSADAFVTNLAPSTLRRFGLAPDDLARSVSGIVVCAVSGFGAEAGPEADKAFDTVIQAAVGIMDTTGTHVGPPTKSGVSLADLLGGFAAAAGILAGLVARERDNRGTVVDVAMSDVALWASQELWALADSGVPLRRANESRCGPATDVVACSDGFVALGPMDAIRQELLASALRTECAELTDTVSTTPVERVLVAARLAGIVAAPVADLADVVRDPQVVARGLILEQTLASGRRISVLGSPFHSLRADVAVRRLAPPLGHEPVAGSSPIEHHKEDG